jgi:hypothetical protein
MTDKIAANKAWRKANPDRYRQLQRDYRLRKAGAVADSLHKYRLERPAYTMWLGARRRARENGLEFSISASDIVVQDICPALGISMFVTRGKRTDNSPTLDRIDNAKGYILGNIIVVSWRANRIKSDATPQELLAIARAYLMEGQATRVEIGDQVDGASRLPVPVVETRILARNVCT